MEPQIQYCHTSDGLRIAYYTMGTGQPLIATPASLAVSMTKEWEAFPQNRLVAQISSRVSTYVRFDMHGSGESDRDDSDVSLESFVRDIKAVADATAQEPFILFGTGEMSAPTMVYAARHPERVSHLVMWGGIAYAAAGTDMMEAILDLALKDWRMATESWCRALENWESEPTASALAAMMREAVTAETFVRYQRERLTWDVNDYLPSIKAPTLVVHPRNHPYLSVEAARRLAATIPGARLALVDSATVSFNAAELASIVGEFLGTTARAQQQPPPPRRSDTAVDTTADTAVVLFTDIADSTALTERLGDAAFRTAARSLDDAVRRAMRETQGRPVEGKVLGDGVMGVFSSAARAIEAARRCVSASAEVELPLHIGIHAGDVIREDGNVFGGAVNIAARICGLSAPGEILVSDIVRDLARTSAGVTFEDRGEHDLKGIEDAVRVYAVRDSAS